MNWLSEPTFWAKIYLAGDIEVAKQVCREDCFREDCFREGLCVTVEKCEYSGYCIGLINYPRFPSTPEKIITRAKDLAYLLMLRTYQHSALVMTPEKTEWLTRRENK